MSNKKEDRLLLQKILGEHFKKNRQKLNLTQEQLAERSHLTVRNYNKIEKGESLPNGQTLTYLLIALAMDPNEYIADYKAQSKFFNDK